MKISPIRWSFSSRSFITRASVSVSRAWIWRREKYTAMTMAMIIATVWTSVRSSGKPISTMRSEQQARLIKIEACGGWDDAMRWADGLSRLSGFRRPNMWTRRALRRPNQSTNHVPGDTSPESDDEHLEPFPPPRPDRDLCLVPADPEERDRAQQDREDRSRGTSLPTKKNGLRGMKCPTTVAVPTRNALALGALASTGDSLSSKDIMNSSSAVGLRQIRSTISSRSASR